MVVKDVLEMFGKNDGELVLHHFLGLGKMDIILDPNRQIQMEMEQKIAHAYEKYSNHYPLQYILGEWGFYGRTFKVGENVLIPRFETEILIEKVLEKGRDYHKILEIGVGTGIISLTLAMELPCVKVIGTDISDYPLALSNENKMIHNVENVDFIKGDIYGDIPKDNSFDLIVSNPPYINKEDMGKLEQKLYKEPELALFGGDDGLYFYRRIIESAKDYLMKGGYIAFEIGYDQGESVRQLLENNGFSKVEVTKDFNGFDRVVMAHI